MHWMCISQVDFWHCAAPQERSATRQQVRRQFSTFPAVKPNLLPHFSGEERAASLWHYEPMSFPEEKQFVQVKDGEKRQRDGEK